MGMISKAGTIVTDKMIEKQSSDAEHGIYPGESSPVFVGQPPLGENDVEMNKPNISISVDLWDLIASKSQRLGVSTDEIVRRALTRELAMM